jgi:hypothetical protein
LLASGKGRRPGYQGRNAGVRGERREKADGTDNGKEQKSQVESRNTIS